LRFYTVYRRPTPARAEPDVVLVKEGFCWPAFLAAPLWILWHRQWLALAAYLIGLALAGAAAVFLDQAGQGVLGLGYHWLVGASANDWRRSGLARAGYRLLDVVKASGLVEAENRLFEGGRWTAATTPAVGAGSAQPPARPRRVTEAAAPLAPWSP
jgi:hypothetical protein